jgi:NapC/NirT cytochrome c family, N-terminal region
MRIPERAARWFRPAFYLSRNVITLTGAVITTSSACTLLWFWAFEILKGGPIHPYAGIVFFFALPGIFCIGLFLMPLGAWWQRRRLRTRGRLPEIYPQIDLRDPLLRRTFKLVAVATGMNIFILGTASYRSVEYMDSAQFCGLTCHTVMAPEYTAYGNSPHQRVECVQCHIGAGASWFVRSKLSGVRQVYAVMFHTYHRPIPSPVEQLRSARETCEECHWPLRFEGDKFLRIAEFSPDEKNTPLTTLLVLKIGGHTWQGSVGIHGRHLDRSERVSYISTDAHRQVIAQVTYLDERGKKIVFNSTDAPATPEQLARGEHRTMDCVDCHNRPTHIFQLPQRAVDHAIFDNLISRELPFVRKKGVELLQAEYASREAARQQIQRGLDDFYRSGYPEIYQKQHTLVEQAGQQLGEIYLRNVFPEMKITWGTYPNNLGHTDFPGCFRCHDGSHISADGRTITNDCSACHNLLSIQEANPKILTDLGMQ